MTQGKGSSRPSTISKRTSSFFTHYHSFPTAPPPGRGKPPQNYSASSAAHTYPTLRSNSGSSRDENGGPSRKHSDSNGESGSHHRRGQSGSSHHEDTPLPTKQLVVLAVIALSEQTALNSISPYLPDMAGSFPEVDTAQIGLYVGLIASSFALAQFLTNFFWGWVSDRVGRKPVILFGTLATAVCFVLFGYCRTLWQAVLVQMLMGLVNGNQGVVSTCLGEITDRTNQSRAFAYLPAIYGLGGITGPLLGGILVGRVFENYTYLLPNLVAAAILIVDLLVTMLFLKESNEGLDEMPTLGKRIGNLFARVWQFASNSTSPTYLKAKRARKNDNAIEDDDDSDNEDASRPLISHRRTSDASVSTTSSTASEHIPLKQILTKPVILILVTYLIFQLSNISYNSLYPVFAQGPPPTGRGLSSEEIGISLSFAGAVTILFQIGVFNKIQATLGNKGTYRFSLGIFVLAFFMMPWVGYADPDDKRNGPLALGSGRITLWIELGFVLLVKTLASVGGLTSAMLLITNSAPTHAVLGTLNGLAQTLSAGGRAIGPFVSGGLFTLSTRLVKGEALAFGVFGAISAVGFLASWGIRAEGLEADEWSDEEDGSEDEDEDER